jgi:hypothetical protein
MPTEESPDEDDDNMVRLKPMFRCSWFLGVKDEAVIALSSPWKVDVDRHKQMKRPISIVELPVGECCAIVIWLVAIWKYFR